MFTSRFKAVSDLDKTLQPDQSRGFVPVRTSLGQPRWIAEARQWPYLPELAPFGLRAIDDKDEFMTLYRERLGKHGVEVILSKLDELWKCQTPGSYLVTPAKERLPLALLCFEDVDKPEDWCHRQVFAAWWLEQTGQVLEELNTADLLPVLSA